jgi:cell division protein FtsW
MNERKSLLLNLVIGLLVICLGGCAAVYCARAYGIHPWYFAGKRMIWLTIGTGLFLLMAQIPFSKLKKAAIPVMGVFVIILFLTALFGKEVNNMRGWIKIPWIDTAVQPSEIAKPFYLLVLCMAAVWKGKSESHRFLSATGITALFCFLILIQPDFGTATIYAVMLPVLLFCADFRKRYTLPVFFGWLPPAILFVMLHPYALRRIKAFLLPSADHLGASWHIHQFRFTMANGGWFGADGKEFSWANTYLPYSHSDSVFASLVEAAGFVGGALVVIGFCVMILLFRKAALDTKEKEARLFIFCAGLMLITQAFLHIGVNVTMIPPTGLPLPFFSYGGSNLAGVMILLGIACSAYRSSSSESHVDSETVKEDK